MSQNVNPAQTAPEVLEASATAGASDTASATGEPTIERRTVVVTPEGMGVSTDSQPGPADLIEEPAKVMRIGNMIKQLLEEVRTAPLDEAGRQRLASIHERSLTELESGLAPELVEELHRISLPFEENSTPSDAELRIAQAQLVGWLEGLFHGIQTALFAQQRAARAQLEQMRRALPGGQVPGEPGGPGAQSMPGMPGMPSTPGEKSPGQYL